MDRKLEIAKQNLRYIITTIEEDEDRLPDREMIQVLQNTIRLMEED